MQIRKMKKEDNLVVKMIIQASLESLGLAIPGSAYFDPQLGELYEYYQGLSNAQYWVVEMAGQVVGGIGIAPFNESEGICELQKLYLIPECQGQGLAKALMTTALSFAKKSYEKCYLETMHELGPACALYEKYDFTLLKAPLTGSEHSAMDAWYLKELKK